jgi:gelsolin
LNLFETFYKMITLKDEQGVGAFKMAELDSHIGGWPIEHRECQNYESERFLSYFRARGGSVRYLNGGFANGFHHHTEKSPHYRFEPRLYQVKGKRSPARLNELSPIDWTSLNRSDVFLLDLLTVVFVWSGKNAIRAERWQALSRARQFREERSGQCNVVCVDDGEEKDMGKEELKLFEVKFPLKDKVSKLKNEPPLPSNTCLEDFKYEMNSYIKLYR